MKKQFKDGDTITVWIGNRPVPTTIVDGVQRLPCNPLYRDLIDSEVVCLNELTIAYQRGTISFESMLEFYLNMGYSVCGFAEIECFMELDIHNPLWEN